MHKNWLIALKNGFLVHNKWSKMKADQQFIKQYPFSVQLLAEHVKEKNTLFVTKKSLKQIRSENETERVMSYAIIESFGFFIFIHMKKVDMIFLFSRDFFLLEQNILMTFNSRNCIQIISIYQKYVMKHKRDYNLRLGLTLLKFDASLSGFIRPLQHYQNILYDFLKVSLTIPFKSRQT